MFKLVFSLCTGSQFRWLMPISSFSRVPNLPIYLGRGEMPLQWELNGLPATPLSDNLKDTLGARALEFTERCLKPIKASLIVAISNTSSYFGAYHWGDDRQQFSDRNDIKWLSFVDPKGTVNTYIAKRSGNLYHWQLFKEHKLYHEAYILHLKVVDSSLITLADKELELLHAMLCTSVTQQKNMYIHCQDGVSHSATVTLAALMFLQHRFHYALPIQQEGNEKYSAELLAWAHQNVRTGLFGHPHPFGPMRPSNQARIQAPLPLGCRLINLDKYTQDLEFSQQVCLSAAEVNTVLNHTTSLDRNMHAVAQINLMKHNHYFSQLKTILLKREIKRYELVVDKVIAQKDYIKALGLAIELASMTNTHSIAAIVQKIFLMLYGMERSHAQYQKIIDDFSSFLLTLPEQQITPDMLAVINYLNLRTGTLNCFAMIKDLCFTPQGDVKKNYYLLLRCLIQSCHEPAAVYFARDIQKIERFFSGAAAKKASFHFFWMVDEQPIAIWCLNILAQVRLLDRPPNDVDTFILQALQNNPAIASTFISDAKKIARLFTKEELWFINKQNNGYPVNSMIKEEVCGFQYPSTHQLLAYQ